MQTNERTITKTSGHSFKTNKNQQKPNKTDELKKNCRNNPKTFRHPLSTIGCLVYPSPAGIELKKNKRGNPPSFQKLKERAGF